MFAAASRAMICARHILALGAVLATGCYLDHGIDPSRFGPPPDAGSDPRMCFEGDGHLDFACPTGTFAPGETIELEVWHSWGGCCSSGVGHVEVSHAGDVWTLASRWEDVCDCCERCACVGPGENVRVTVGPLFPGVNVIRSERVAVECRIVAEEPSLCIEAPTATRTARVLFPDQSDDVTLTHVAGSDCGCDPRVRVRDLETSLALCDCGDVCDDAITLYQGHARGPARPPGDYVRVLGGATSPLSVRDPSECHPSTPLGITLELPDPTAQTTGEPLVWVGVTGEHL